MFVPNKKTAWAVIVGLLTSILCTNAPSAAASQIVPAFVSRQAAVGHVPESTPLEITFGLPLRNREALTNLLHDLYQPGSPSYHKYLTPDEFAAQFGPAEADYQAVVNFAKAHGLKVKRTHSNRTLLDVEGASGDVEKALHVHLNYYRHPTENRNYFAPDATPSLDLDTPVLAITGLQNFSAPHPLVHPRTIAQPQTGSGPSGAYIGRDFRNAYAPGVALDGSGQSVALFEGDGFSLNDITNYEILANITNRPVLTPILIDGFPGGPIIGGLSDVEVALDIEMAISMAPALSNIFVYESSPTSTIAPNDVLNQMAIDNSARQIGCSWGFDINTTTEQIFQQFAAQGQSLFQASGDSDAYSGPVTEPSDDPNVTVVGGTELSTGTNGAWASESVWNDNDGVGSSGGISEVNPIPSWQQGINMTTNKGSTTFRNLPDVALTGYNVWVEVTNESGNYQGTSCAAPLWAGFAALVNQQAVLNGQPPLGFANPAIYNIGRSTNYLNCFHDITAGNNFNGSSPKLFPAVPGYDLCTGWGTPTGSNLIAALLQPLDGLQISPALGFTATGPVGGPFHLSRENYLLTNTGNGPLTWNASASAPWLEVSQSNGTLSPGGPATEVTVSLNSAATNMLMGDFSGTITFDNLQDGVLQSWPYALLIGNGGFETGDFTNWIFSGNPGSCFPVASDDGAVGSALPGVNYDQFVHSGLYGTFLGQAGSLGSLSQTLPTTAGQYYLLSCWLTSIAYNGATIPNEFRVDWNGAAVFDQIDMAAFGWTNVAVIVEATNTATPMEFDFRADPGALGLDDITVQRVPPPVFQSVSLSHGAIAFTWNALPGLSYQLQSTTNLARGAWTNVNGPIIATTNVVTASDAQILNPQRFYRFVVSP